MASKVRQLHSALLDLVAIVNRPQRDSVLIQAAGITLDRAMFPLLVGIGRVGPIGVAELAEMVGRDHTTVSRQVAKLESLGLVSRQPSEADKRVREASLTPKGRTMSDAVDAARERLASAILKDWSERDLHALIRLMRRLADDLKSWQA